MTDAEGALIEPLVVGLTAAREAGAGLGQTAVILGSGCIGLVTLLALKSMGVENITVIDLFDFRLNKARDLGTWQVINAKQQDAIAEVKRLYDGLGPDLVFESAGNVKAASQTVHMVRRGGTVMIIGNVTGETPINLQLMTNKEITLKTNFRYRNIYPTAIATVSSGRIHIGSIVSRLYPLSDTHQAFEDCILEKATMVKAMIEIDAQ